METLTLNIVSCLLSQESVLDSIDRVNEILLHWAAIAELSYVRKWADQTSQYGSFAKKSIVESHLRYCVVLEYRLQVLKLPWIAEYIELPVPMSNILDKFSLAELLSHKEISSGLDILLEAANCWATKASQTKQDEIKEEVHDGDYRGYYRELPQWEAQDFRHFILYQINMTLDGDSYQKLDINKWRQPESSLY